MTEKDKDFLEGVAISAACHVLPVRKKQPIAYSYNGVILPALPEWDREMYPYAVIRHSKAYSYTVNGVTYSDVEKYALVVADEPFYGEDVADGYGAGCMFSILKTWICRTPELSTWEFGEGINSPGVSRPVPGIWANHDVLDKDSEEVYISASEPIPIYE